MKNTVSVICVAAVVACRSAAIDGNAGRYMSMANGPMADSSPSTMALRLKEDTMRVFFLFEAGQGQATGAISVFALTLWRSLGHEQGCHHPSSSPLQGRAIANQPRGADRLMRRFCSPVRAEYSILQY